MVVPLLFKSQVVGVLVLAHRQPEYFDQRTMALAQAFANQVAEALGHLIEQHDGRPCRHREAEGRRMLLQEVPTENRHLSP